jgi:hypothetical protein
VGTAVLQNHEIVTGSQVDVDATPEESLQGLPEITEKVPLEPVPDVQAIAFGTANEIPRSLADPVNNDPLDLLVGPSLTKAHKLFKRDLYVYLPDEVGFPIAEVTNSARELKPALSALGIWVKWSPAEGALIGRPRRAAEARLLRLDRIVLKRHLPQLAKGIAVAPDALATYALEQNPLNERGLERLILGASVGRIGIDRFDGLFYTTGSRNFLRAYASLPPDARTALWSGQPIEYAPMLPATRALIDQTVFAGNLTIINNNPNRRSFVREVTELLPNGVPPATVLRFDAKEDIGCYLVESKFPLGQAVWEAPSLGYILYQQEKGMWLGGDGGYPDVRQSLWQPVLNTLARPMLEFGEGWTAPSVGRLSRVITIEGTKPVRYQDLPATHLQPLLDTLKSYKSRG